MNKILFIEDDLSILTYIKKVLEKSDYIFTAAINGQEGVEKAKELQPDLIVCDVMLPFMDGFKVVTELKKDTETESIPFVFLSALSQRENVRQGMNLGAEDYLTKPFDRKELLAMITAQFKKQERIAKRIEKTVREYRKKAETNSPAPIKSFDNKNPYVLVVDDSEINRKICENFFVKSKIPFKLAANGHEAISLIMESEPSVILLDIVMPVMDGMDTIKIIRKNKDWNHIHIIAMSSTSYENDIVNLIKLGANDYILKPLKWNLVASKLEKVTHLKKYIKR